jgi:hypothetical protein
MSSTYDTSGRGRLRHHRRRRGRRGVGHTSITATKLLLKDLFLLSD